ncbi:MAG: hypothetical protein AAGJ93_01870 [Bacteroidota bacterium]
MKSNTSPIDRYKTEDLRQLLYTIPIGHLFLGLLLLSPDVSSWSINYSAQICLLLFIAFLFILKYYDWEDKAINRVIIFTYLSILLGEYCLVGLPGSLAKSGTGMLGKGAITELFLFSLPYIYLGIRCFLLIPIILIARWKQ